MMKIMLPRNLILSLSMLMLCTAGCTSAADASGTYAWIDVPVHDLTLPLGEAIHIEGHAADPEGVSHVEIWVNGELTWTVDELAASGDLVRFQQSWTPGERGDHVILAVAYGADGRTSSPDSVTVHIVDVPGPTSTPSPVVTEQSPVEITITPDEEEALQVQAQFWADPAEIDAGACSTLHWRVENAEKVALGSTQVDPEGQYETCHCSSSSYRLTVTSPDNSEQVYTVSIQVNGTCDPPTPVPDETAPTAPGLLKPLNGSDLGCIADTILRWNAASDGSGIDEYQVQVQRHPGDDNWAAAPGSPWTRLSGTQLPLNVQCGWTYRWRVRAVDGAGNVGPWSGWWSFNIPLL